jgi:hypothetical protein
VWCVCRTLAEERSTKHAMSQWESWLHCNAFTLAEATEQARWIEDLHQLSLNLRLVALQIICSAAGTSSDTHTHDHMLHL